MLHLPLHNLLQLSQIRGMKRIMYFGEGFHCNLAAVS